MWKDDGLDDVAAGGWTDRILSVLWEEGGELGDTVSVLRVSVLSDDSSVRGRSRMSRTEKLLVLGILMDSSL